MISKKNISPSKKVILAAIDAAEYLGKLTPTFLGVAAVVFTVAFIQKEINRKVEINCPDTISVVVHHPTAVGPAYQCVSRAQLHGPAPTYKP